MLFLNELGTPQPLLGSRIPPDGVAAGFGIIGLLLALFCGPSTRFFRRSEKNRNAMGRCHPSTGICLYGYCFSHGYAIVFFPAKATGELMRTGRKSAVFQIYPNLRNTADTVFLFSYK